MRVVSVAEMRELERQTFVGGTPEAELQQRAGAAVAAIVARSSQEPGLAVAFIGAGNNGRDAWIAAQDLLHAGWRARLYLTPRHTISDDELRGFLNAGGELCWHPDSKGSLPVEAALQGATVALDGLLGIGGRGAPRSPIDIVITGLNRVREQRPGLRVVAVDVPSGVDADTGEAPGHAIRADLTVVLGGAKPGLLTPGGAIWTGTLEHADIGVVDTLPNAPMLIDRAYVRGRLKAPPPAAHKGTFGRLLVVAGSERYLGAATLVCLAAARAGAGIVTLAAPGWLRDVVAAQAPEVTYLPLPDEGPAGAAKQCANLIADELDRYAAVALGPGLSTDGQTITFVELLLRRRAAAGLPVIIDADGLNALSTFTDWPDWIGAQVILTPHLGELQRLAPALPIRDVHPWIMAHDLAQTWGVTLVVKGPFTGIGDGDQTWVHARPNPALATAGTGDVLTGIIGGLLARGQAPDGAATLGVWLHGEAGGRASVGIRAGGLLASDLLGYLPGALTSLLMERP